jgi:CHAT domain-containing protein
LAVFVLAHYRWSDVRTAYSVYRAESLIRAAQLPGRRTLGRTNGAPYAAFRPDITTPDDLGRAEILLLRLPSTRRVRYLQSLIELNTRNLQRAASSLTDLSAEQTDASVSNALGVAFLELADSDPLNLFRALDQFEQAEKLDPNAPEPHFNRLIVLRRLHLAHQFQSEQEQYIALERSGPWHDELMRSEEISEEEVATKLQAAVDQKNDALIAQLFASFPEICRTMAMRYGTDPINTTESEAVATTIGRMISKSYQDETVTAMLEALHQPDRPALITARKLVAQGADAFLKGDMKGSLQAYDEAVKALDGTNSAFDHLWLDLNRAITDVRIPDIDSAAVLLDRVVSESRQRNFKWLLASALSSYGAIRSLNPSFSVMMDRLLEAATISEEIASPKVTARARFYITGQTYYGGDLDNALKTSLDCLRLIDVSDHLRVGSVLSILDVVLYKKGFVRQAVTVGEEALAQASESKNPLIVGAAGVSLGLAAELTGQEKIADVAIARAEAAVQGFQGTERVRSQVAIENTKGRMLLHRGRIQEAVSSLEVSREGISQNLAPVSSFETETLALLGEAYAQQKRVEDARKIFREAVDSAERDNDFAKNEKSRIAFDDNRRELYDAAIGFEYEQGSKEAAWTYLQKYRAKVFIEMLAQFNPEVEKVHSIALDLNQAQKAIPQNMQVVEYALLPDRVLIWVVTKNKFETRSLPINRAAVEEKVQQFLADLRAGAPEIRANAEIYNILIGPIKDLLEDEKPVAIIPDRALHGLPFGAIRCPENRYLIEYYPMIESPTLTHLLAVDKGQVNRDTIVTFGSRAEDVAETREIGAIKTIYRKVSPFTGQQVTKTRFLDEMEHASIFHYAGHSAHDAADPLRSAILLDGDKGGPNSVTAVDIVGRKLRPDSLVILSSCDSSVGNSKDGVGIRGLTSAFLVSGASAVVGSLWTVESTSTSELMIGFHKAFATEHLPIANALRQAQLAFIQSNSRHSHPYYWSGFVVTSNFSALR